LVEPTLPHFQMQSSVIDSILKYSLHLDSDWQIDRVTVDLEKQRVDVYLSHSGENLVCPETGNQGHYMIIAGSGVGDIWTGFSANVMSMVAFPESSLLRESRRLQFLGRMHRVGSRMHLSAGPLIGCWRPGTRPKRPSYSGVDFTNSMGSCAAVSPGE